jgi:hypothetical protein
MPKCRARHVTHLVAQTEQALRLARHRAFRRAGGRCHVRIDTSREIEHAFAGCGHQHLELDATHGRLALVVAGSSTSTNVETSKWSESLPTISNRSQRIS